MSSYQTESHQKTNKSKLENDDDYSYSIVPEKSTKKYYIYGIIFVIVLIVIAIVVSSAATNSNSTTPVTSTILIKPPCIITTWHYPNATTSSWLKLSQTDNTLDAVIEGIKNCSNDNNYSCINVGPYQNPNMINEITLDAMLFYGPTHDIGSVTNLRNITNAIDVAKYVLLYSNHTILNGNKATEFAKNFGFIEEKLGNKNTTEEYQEWINPTNINTKPCYDPPLISSQIENVNNDNLNGNCSWIAKHEYKQLNIGNIDKNEQITEMSGCQVYNDIHDSIAIIAINDKGEISLGTQSNGIKWRVPGRVSEASIPGSGGYIDKDVGACIATGKGDILLRFAPAKAGITFMKEGNDVQLAAEKAMFEMRNVCNNQEIVVLCVDLDGNVGVAFWTTNNIWEFMYQNANGLPISKIKENTWD